MSKPKSILSVLLIAAVSLPSCANNPRPLQKRGAAEEAPLALGTRTTPGTTENGTGKTLYERLGGYDAISAVVDEFGAKLFNDPVVGKRFFGMSDDSRARFRQHNKNLICNVTGGPCKVSSRPAEVAHGGLGIKASEFDIVVGHLVDTLKGFNVPAAEQEELLRIIGTLRPKIVEVEDQ